MSLLKRIRWLCFPRSRFKRLVMLTVLLCLMAIWHILLIPVLLQFKFLDERSYIEVVNRERSSLFKLNATGSSSTSPAVLVLFTSFKDIASRRAVNLNTLYSWPRIPGLIPVLYYTEGDDTANTDLAVSLGWRVYPAPIMHHNIPVLKHLFLHTLTHITPTPMFVGFANSDVLFTLGLIETLKFIHSIKGEEGKRKGMLIGGRKINTLVSEIYFHPNTHSISNTIHNVNSVTYGNPKSFEYLIYNTAYEYPWKVVPDFVLGKPGFDSWLVREAIQGGMVTVDATHTIMALHQTLSATNKDKGWFATNVCYNRELIDPTDLRPGRTNCLEYVTGMTPVGRGTQGVYTLGVRRRRAYDCQPLDPIELFLQPPCRVFLKRLTEVQQEYKVHHFTKPKKLGSSLVLYLLEAATSLS